jgi:hypothetical protein
MVLVGVHLKVDFERSNCIFKRLIMYYVSRLHEHRAVDMSL